MMNKQYMIYVVLLLILWLILLYHKNLNIINILKDDNTLNWECFDFLTINDNYFKIII